MSKSPKMEIFRYNDSPWLEESGVQPVTAIGGPVEVEGWGRMKSAGYSEGQEARLVVQLPGLSMLHIWSKQNYATPLHSHCVDCLYFVISGSVHMGTEILRPRDALFVPADMPYTYSAGPNGAEVLEIRQADAWDVKLLMKTARSFDRAVATVEDNISDWRQATLPTMI